MSNLVKLDSSYGAGELLAEIVDADETPDHVLMIIERDGKHQVLWSFMKPEKLEWLRKLLNRKVDEELR